MDSGSILKSSGSRPDSASIRKIAKGFESYFAGELIKAMRAGRQPDKLLGGGRGEDTMNMFLDQAYADAIASRGSLGIAKMVEEQLTGGNGYVKNRNQTQVDCGPAGACGNNVAAGTGKGQKDKPAK